MKREITNYPAFLEAINTLFSHMSICDVNTYNEEMAASKQKRKEKIAAISLQLRQLKTDIEKYKEQIRLAQKQEDKKTSGQLLNQLLATKMSLLKAYKEQKNLSSFSELSIDAKTYACSQSLIQKYLLPAFVKSSREATILNKDGTVTLNVDYFLNSTLYQQAQHIKDYIAAYIEKHPARVNGSRYFTGLYKNVEDFEELINIADDFFDKINAGNEKTKETILQSYQGIEVLEVYPEHYTQAVRLLTKEALSYEGRKMRHCVATYDSKVANGETEIYSIRDYGDNNTEFVPHATIEFKDGKVKQIKGYRDSLVDCDYIDDTRRLVMSLMKTDDLSVIMNTSQIPASEKKNIGFFADTAGTMHDIFSPTSSLNDIVLEVIRLKSNRLKTLNGIKIKFKTLEIDGPIYPKTIEQLSAFQDIDRLILHLHYYSPILNLSSISCPQLELDFSKETDIHEIIFPANINEVTIKGNHPVLTSLHENDNLEILKLSGDFPHLVEIPFFPALKKLDLTGKTFDSLEKLDLSSYTNLKIIHLSGSSFSKLKEINIPETVKTFQCGQSSFPSLEKLDCSLLPINSFNTIEVERLVTIPDGDIPEQYKCSFPILTGYSISFATMPNLKKLLINKDVEQISFHGIYTKRHDFINFSEYENLKTVLFQYCDVFDNEPIDLSSNKMLHTIYCKFSSLSNIIPPENVSEMHLNIEEEEAHPQIPQNWGLNSYPNLKTLHADFIPICHELPPSIESLSLELIQNYEHYSEIKTLDFSALKHVKMHTSAGVKFPKFERLVMPEKFSILNWLSPLKEVDFSKTNGAVNLKIRILSRHENKQQKNIQDDYANDEQELYLHPNPDQIALLKKIKLGKNTDLILPQEMENAPITLEVSADTSREKEQRLKEQYPNLTITRAAAPQTVLLLPQIQKQIGRGS